MVGMAERVRSSRWTREQSETEFARVVAFSDGVIAIALTLLELNFDTPDVPAPQVAAELAALWPTFLSYAISFAVIGALWVSHHSFFAELRGFDSRLMRLNLLYLSLIVLIPFTTNVFDSYGEVPAGPMLYAAVLAAASLVAWTMGRYAVRAGFVAGAARSGAHGSSLRDLVTPAIFLLSVPLALVIPEYTPLIWLAGLILARRFS
jgi:uncharacterized membrane protein